MWRGSLVRRSIGRRDPSGKGRGTQTRLIKAFEKKYKKKSNLRI